MSIWSALFGKQSAVSKPTPSTSASDDVALINTILDETLDGLRFIALAKERGFQHEEDSFLGTSMASPYGRLMFQVFASHHPRNIFNLIYKVKGGASVTLVNEGKRCR